MAYNFKNALVRTPCKSISNALSSIGEKPDFEKVISEHNDYKMQLERSDIKIITLDARTGKKIWELKLDDYAPRRGMLYV